MVPQLDSIMQNLNKLLADPALAQTLKNTAALTGELKQSAEQLNVMMKGDIPATLASLKHRPMQKNFQPIWPLLMCRPRSTT